MSTSEPLALRADPPVVLDVPPAHLELRWRPLRAEDASALHTLLEAMAVVDAAKDRSTVDEVVEALTMPGVDLSSDSLAGLDDDGTLRAYGLVELRTGEDSLRALLRGGVDPRWRGRGIGRAVLAWVEGRGRQMLAASGLDVPARIAVMVDEAARDQRRLYAAAGFSPVRWYTTMRRDLARPLPEVPLPEGIRVVAWSVALEEPVRLAHNEAFTDHWGWQPISAQAWSHHEVAFAPRWSFAAVTPDDEVAGYVISGRRPQDWPALGYTCGVADLVGVRRPWRGHGLAAALLVAAMAAYRDDGMEYATLLVDTANPTGAVGLYERLGFTPTHGHVMYSVEI